MSDAMASPEPPEACASDQAADSAAANGLSKDLRDFYERRGSKALARLEASRKEKKHDVDVLTDRDLERLTITLRTDTEEDDRRVIGKATKEQRERFKQYRHHKFVKRWEASGSEALPDEEWFVSDPEVLPEDDPGYLCDLCRHLDFATLLTKRGLPGNNIPSMPTQIQIYGLWRVMQEGGNRCAFCGLLRRKIVEGGSLSRMSGEDIRDECTLYINVLDEGPEYALRLEIQVEAISRTVERFVVQRVEERPQQPLAGRLVHQDRADMACLREWLQVCDDAHPSSTKGLEVDLDSLRVIDTEELRVREVETPCRYACLSYVWGKGSQTQYTTATRNSLEAPNGLQVADLPQTIKDAITVTKEAGLRYLWVDALCILQDDAADKAKIISKMGPIYGGATLTIVASAHADPHEGLPGMGNARRPVAQDMARIQGMTLALGLHDPRQPIPDIDGSAWGSRAWTFQERALSARSVYFTHSQMVFKCVHGAVMLEESVPVPDPAFRHQAIEDQTEMDLIMQLYFHPSLSRWQNKGFSTRNEDAKIMITTGIDMESYHKMSLKEKREIAPVFDIKVDPPCDFMGSLGDNAPGSTPWDLYRRAVHDYTKRKLTWQSDAVNAFAGVEHIVRRGTNTKFWFGLPSFAFEQALLWRAMEPLELRTEGERALFPSWSWAAWQGEVFYSGRGWKNSVHWEPLSVVRWYVDKDPQWFIDGFKSGGDKTEEEIKEFTEQVSKASLLVRELNPYRHVDCLDEDGWVLEHDEEYNRHLYSHDAYPGVRFTYPVDLPGDIIEDRPDINNVLLFNTHVVPIIPCDMNETSFKVKVEDRFLQLGINDESRSANRRPAFQRIIYHQGYRAGFLTLNNPESLPAEGSGNKYYLAAISRGSMSHVPPPPSGWDHYWATEPRKIHYHLLREEWDLGLSNAPAPNEGEDAAVGPNTRAQKEDGDPHWDTGRFGGFGAFDVYEVLLLMKTGGKSLRMGAGRVSYCAFAAARPREMSVNLF